jgi:two-component system OmpR family response regulator
MRILIIEDDIDLRESVRLSLEAGGFAVDATSDGERGSYMARTTPYDVIVLDKNLPKKNGDAICDELREAGCTSFILMVSVHGNTRDRVIMLERGVDDYISKPFSFEELHARVHALLRRPQELKPDNLSIDTLELDRIHGVAKRNSQRIHLTRKEFSLLEYLLVNKGKILSRGMIMEHVWNSTTDPFSNTIESHIMNLRRKTEKGRQSRLIFNVPGRGYKIDIEK